MHIIYLHQYFATPESATGTRSYEFAKRWVAKGHHVTMVTSTTNISENIKDNNIKRNGRIEFDCDGISVIALDIRYDNKMGKLQRLLSFVTFCLKSSFVASRLRNADVVFATSTPLTIAIPALWVKFRRRIPYVFEVRDLWPYNLICNGIIKNPLLVKLSLWFEKYVYKRAGYIVGLSPSMKDYIDNVTSEPDKTISAPNCADIDYFKPVAEEKKNQIKAEMGWQNKFLIAHIGAIGRVNALDRFLIYAQRLKEYDDIRFVIIGIGSEKQKIRKLIKQYYLKNVEMLDSLPKKSLARIMPAIDIGFSSVHRKKHAEANSANKFFDYLASGIPVIVNYGGWQEEALRKANAGFGAPDFNDDLVIESILKLYNNSQLRLELGRNARQLAERQFSRDLLSDRVLQQIQKCYDDHYGKK